jgi:hypothetical protein
MMMVFSDMMVRMGLLSIAIVFVMSQVMCVVSLVFFSLHVGSIRLVLFIQKNV